MKEVIDFINKNSEVKYKDFIKKLIPTKDISYFKGVRNPILKKCAKELILNKTYNIFLDELPHTCYEEYMLHGYVISFIKDYNECLNRLEEYLPYIDNWSCCDTLKPVVFNKHKEELINNIYKWLKSDLTYTKRYAIGLLMDLYLDNDFDNKYLEIVSKEGRIDDYYLNMMIAWYYATALTKKWDEAIPYIQNNILIPWIHNKTIQKAIESNRITKDKKEYLRGLKIKNV